MKSLFALLAVALALGATYWKTQNPDAGVEDFRTHVSSTAKRLQGGLAAIRDGGSVSVERDQQAAAEKLALSQRVDSIEEELAKTLTEPAVSTVVDGRLTDIERRLNADKKKQAGIAQEVGSLSSADQSITARIDSLDAMLTKQLNKQQEYQTRQKAFDKRLDLLARRTTELNMEAELVKTNKRLDNVDVNLKQLQDKQQNQLTELSSSVAGVSESTQTLAARINTLSSAASNGQSESATTVNAQIDQRIALLEEKLNTANSDSRRLAALSQQLNATRNQLAILENGYATSSDSLTTMRASIADLKTSSESNSIDTLQTQISEQLASLQSQVDNSSDNTNVNSLTNALDSARSRIQTLEQRVIDLPASSDAADSASQVQGELQQQITALESRLATLDQEPDPVLANSISEVQEQVSKLASKSYVTQEELRSQQQSKKTIEYKIYFELNSTAITEAAGKVLNSFITQEKNRTTGVSIYGFTDRRGSAVYNQQLALQRATNVRSYLIQNGFDYTKINSLNGLGEDAAAADIEDGAEDAQQRSVVLYAAQP